VERHWHQKIKRNTAQALVFESGVQPGPNEMPKVNLPAIFEIVHDPANDSAASVGGDGRLKFESAMGAVRTGEISINRPGERLGTGLAKRRHNPAQFATAIVT
jgi:hypothetical protein